MTEPHHPWLHHLAHQPVPAPPTIVWQGASYKDPADVKAYADGVGETQHCILRSDETGRQTWDVCMSFLIIFTCVAMPMSMHVTA
jgi:hypothetical protein